MRIGTFNSRGSKRKLDAITKESKMRKLDICLLQEFRSVTEAQLQDFTNNTGMQLHLNGVPNGERQDMGIAIAYKTTGDIQPTVNVDDIQPTERDI